MTTNYTLPLTSFVSGKVLIGRLVSEVRKALPASPMAEPPGSFDGVNAVVSFQSALDATGLATLNALVAAHPQPVAINHASAMIVPGEVEITEDQAWQFVAATVSRPSFFVPNIAAAAGQILGAALAQGTQAQIRVLQDGAQIISANVANNNGVWSVMSILGGLGQMGTSHHQYVLEARRNGASVFRLRGVSMNLLELT